MLDLIIDFCRIELHRSDLPVVKIFSGHEVDLKWVWLIELPFENPGYRLETVEFIIHLSQSVSDSTKAKW